MATKETVQATKETATKETVQTTKETATKETVQATKETVQATENFTKMPFSVLPKFTSERWREGIYDAGHKMVSPSLTIREEDLLTFDEKVEVETRKLIFQYQLKYAEKEYELLKKEFQSIEERLNQKRSSDAEPAEPQFVKPHVPVEKKTRKKAGRSAKNKTKSGSETDEQGASAGESGVSEDQKSTKKRGKRDPTMGKSGSETDDGVSSDDKSKKRPLKEPKKKPAKSKSGSETDKELTSSLEMDETHPRRSRRNMKEKIEMA